MLSEMLSVGTRKHYHKHGYGPGLPHRPANMETPRRRVIVKEKRACVADEYEAGLTNVPFKLNVQRLSMCICLCVIVSGLCYNPLLRQATGPSEKRKRTSSESTSWPSRMVLEKACR